MRRGIFGGTFDPIHFGHIHAIAFGLDRFHLDVIHVMIAGDPYHKDVPGADASTRLRWVKEACNEFYANRNDVLVDDREIRRGGQTYTIDTVRELKNEFPNDDLVLLVGEDIPETMSSWKDGDELTKLVEIAVIPRKIFPTSATYIREQCSTKKPVTGLLPAFIEAEIIEKSLYNGK
jgi:nicotinate-nucleotide adenylyltransferase